MGLTGTSTYENKATIKGFIFKIKQNAPDTEIVSLGSHSGADKYVKKYAMEFGLAYREINPPHTTSNLYSLMPDSFYEKPYSVKGFHVCNKIFASYVNSCVIFDNSGRTDKVVNSVVGYLNKAHKKTMFLT